MSTGRLEAFSDGVFSILITIMVLELKVPHGTDLEALRPLLPSILTYALSFVFLGIYWNNHHHMLHQTDHVTGGIMWANLHLLFWLSLVPFATGWMGENHFDALPTAVYAGVLLCAGIAFTILSRTIIASQGLHSKLRAFIGPDTKGNVSIAIYVAAIPLAFVHRYISDALIVSVALMWFVPDRRIESKVNAPQ
jgi:TMEM175 potassium channel family protein